MEATGMIAVARGRHVIFGTGPVVAALAHAMEQSVRSVISIPVNEYGSDPYGIAIMRGDRTDLEFARKACSGAEAIYSCLNGPINDWKSTYESIVDTLIESARTTFAKLVHWDLAHIYGATCEPITKSTVNSAKTSQAQVLIDLSDKVIDATWVGQIDGVIGRLAKRFNVGAFSLENTSL